MKKNLLGGIFVVVTLFTSVGFAMNPEQWNEEEKVSSSRQMQGSNNLGTMLRENHLALHSLINNSSGTSYEIINIVKNFAMNTLNPEKENGEERISKRISSGSSSSKQMQESNKLEMMLGMGQGISETITEFLELKDLVALRTSSKKIREVIQQIQQELVQKHKVRELTKALRNGNHHVLHDIIRNSSGLFPETLKNIVEALIIAGANVSAVDRSLYETSWFDATKRSLDETPLHVAIKYGHFNLVPLLIKAGANVNAMNWNSETPLYLTARYGHVNVAERLIAAGANVNAVNAQNETPLHMAARYGRTDVAKLLTNHLTNHGTGNYEAVDTGNIFNETPLYLAIRAGDFELAKFLIITARANVHVVDLRYNNNLLHLVTKNRGNSGMVQFLIDAGVDVNAMNQQGKTPQDLAINCGFFDAQDLLRTKMNAPLNVEEKSAEEDEEIENIIEIPIKK